MKRLFIHSEANAQLKASVAAPDGHSAWRVTHLSSPLTLGAPVTTGMAWKVLCWSWECCSKKPFTQRQLSLKMVRNRGTEAPRSVSVLEPGQREPLISYPPSSGDLGPPLLGLLLVWSSGPLLGPLEPQTSVQVCSTLTVADPYGLGLRRRLHRVRLRVYVH